MRREEVVERLVSVGGQLDGAALLAAQHLHVVI